MRAPGCIRFYRMNICLSRKPGQSYIGSIHTIPWRVESYTAYGGHRLAAGWFQPSFLNVIIHGTDSHTQEDDAEDEGLV
ncbi:hypothetical protein J43TS9_60820 [Paenibacillus cineris]|nr:hypothetical protein J43TS9_60820 [Paenibacillus cineris]